MAGKVGTGFAAIAGLFVGSLAGDAIGAAVGGKKGMLVGGLLGSLAGTFAGAAIAANASSSSGTGVAGLPPQQPAGLGAVPHKCTAKSAAAIAKQIDNSYEYSHSMPPDGALRCGPQTTRSYDVTTAMGRKSVPAKFCGGGSVMVLQCPYTHEQFVFQKRGA